MAYYPCCTWPHQVLTRTFSYQHLLLDSTTSGAEENLLLSAYLRRSAPPWLNTFGRSHSKYSTTVEPAFLSRDTSWVCLCLERLGVCCYNYGLTGPALMLWVVLVTTVVTIFRFTITPTTAVVCFRWALLCGRMDIPHSKVLLIVLVSASTVVPILGWTPHHSYWCHGLTL